VLIFVLCDVGYFYRDICRVLLGLLYAGVAYLGCVVGAERCRW
jgi:hypothetical protein